MSIIYTTLSVSLDSFYRISHVLESMNDSFCNVCNNIPFDKSDTTDIEVSEQIICEYRSHITKLEHSISNYESIVKHKDLLIQDLHFSLLDHMVMSIKFSLYKGGTPININKDIIKEYITSLNVSHVEWPNAIVEYMLSIEPSQSDNNGKIYSEDNNFKEDLNKSKDNDCIIM